MPNAHAKLVTPNASKYLQQLCKHFAHKLDVSFTENSGQIALPTGPAELASSSSELRISIKVEEGENLDRAKNIIDKHLIKFAFRENIHGLDWTTDSEIG